VTDIRIDVIAATEDAVRQIKNVSVSINDLDKKSGKAGSGIKDVGDGIDETGKKSKSATDILGGMALTFGAIGIAAIGVQKVMQGVKKAFEFTREGAEIRQTADAFDSVTDSAGGLYSVLPKLREASNGTISDMELMSSTMTLLQGTSGDLNASLLDSADDILRIAKAASELNPAMGDTNFQYQSLMTAAKRGSKLLADNAGILVGVGTANKKYAESIGKTVDQLTEEEKQIAFVNEMLFQGQKLVNQAEKANANYTDTWDKLTTAIKNNTDRIKKNVSENKTLIKVMDDTADAMNNSRSWREKLDQAVEAGIMTEDEYYQMILKVNSGEMELSDSIVYLTDLIEEYNDNITRSADLTDEWANNNYDFEPSLEEVAEAIEEATKANNEYIDSVLKADEINSDYKEELGELEEEMGDVSGRLQELADKPWLTKDEQEEVKDLRGEYFDLQGQITDLEAEHDRAVKEMIADLLLMKLTLDGDLTASETAFYLQFRKSLGLLGDDAETFALTMIGAADDIYAEYEETGGEMQAVFDFLSRMDGKVVNTTVITTYLEVYKRTTGSGYGGGITGGGATPQTQALGGLYQTATPTLFEMSEMNQIETTLVVPQGKTLYDVAPASKVNDLLGQQGQPVAQGGGNTYNFNVAAVEEAIRTYDQLKVLT
jgi:methyl-accepting chemotaxis protein